MRAVQWFGRGDVRLVDVPELGDPPPGWVRLRVQACGICGTDLEEYRAGPIVIPRAPHPTTGAQAPLTLGHEAVGVVEATASDVDLPLGQRVAVEGHIFCGSCAWCLAGQYALCDGHATLGLHANGGLAQEMLAPASMCLPYANHVDPEVAAFAEPLSVAVRATRRGGVTGGCDVAVVGTGTIGLLTIQVARLLGARRVVAVERIANRRRLAETLGAEIALDTAEASEALADLTAGAGFDVVFEAAGTAESLRQAVKWTKKGGRTTVLGVFDGPAPIDVMDLLLGEKEIVASLSHSYDVDFPEAIELLEQSRIEVLPMLTDRVSLDDVVTHGFEALCANSDSHLKVMVLPELG